MLNVNFTSFFLYVHNYFLRKELQNKKTDHKIVQIGLYNSVTKYICRVKLEILLVQVNATITVLKNSNDLIIIILLCKYI